MSSEAAVSYAALILADSEVEINAENLLTLTKQAGVKVDSVSNNDNNHTYLTLVKAHKRLSGKQSMIL